MHSSTKEIDVEASHSK